MKPPGNCLTTSFRRTGGLTVILHHCLSSSRRFSNCPTSIHRLMYYGFHTSTEMFEALTRNLHAAMQTRVHRLHYNKTTAKRLGRKHGYVRYCDTVLCTSHTSHPSGSAKAWFYLCTAANQMVHSPRPVCYCLLTKPINLILSLAPLRKFCDSSGSTHLSRVLLLLGDSWLCSSYYRLPRILVQSACTVFPKPL